MNTPYSRHLVSLICNFENELKQYRQACPLMAQSISTQIVIQIIRESGTNLFQASKPVMDKNHMDRAQEYIRTFYYANIRIEDICNQIHLSPYYFIRMFRESTGMTPHEYLLKIRMEKALELLRKGNHSIEEVSGLIGFISPAHFSSAFRKAMGISPSEYRKRCK
jgi:AraC-like DNA-binding protein